VSDIDIGAFLRRDREHPEHRALLQLIGTLVQRYPQHTGGESRSTGLFYQNRSQRAHHPQIPAQSASDRSNVAIKVGRVLGSWAGSSQSSSEQAWWNRILLSTSPLPGVHQLAYAIAMPDVPVVRGREVSSQGLALALRIATPPQP